MLLRDYLHESGITLFACLPADLPPLVKPRLLAPIPEARSVLFAALPYRVVGEESAHLAAFARARDYHAYATHLTKECRRILALRHPHADVIGFADHSPYAEVRGASMAGLGEIGDHGLLITEKYASYVFIFELVTTLSLEEMAEEGIPAGDGILRECGHCGACTRACPGGCTGGDRTRCLSAISQKKGELSEEEAELLRRSPYIWGCDICQDVCPHSAHAAETEIPYFRKERILRLTEDAISAMPEEEYTSYAFGWRKKEIMLRNLRLKEERHDD